MKYLSAFWEGFIDHEAEGLARFFGNFCGFVVILTLLCGAAVVLIFGLFKVI